MIDLIRKLLIETEFELENDEVGLFSYNISNNIFYVIRNYNSIEEFRQNIYKDQDYFFDLISIKHNGNEMKKNTSFLILVKLNDPKEKKDIQSLILELEEDKYYFKKYIMTYTNEEILDFKEKTKGYKNSVDFVKKSLNNDDNFEEFKINNTLSFYSLILKLYIKIPHLSYKNIFEKNQIEDLLITIEKKLKENSLDDYYKKISTIEESDIDKYIDSIICRDDEVI